QLLAVPLGDLNRVGEAAMGQGNAGAGISDAGGMADPQQVVLEQIDADAGNAGAVQFQQVGGGGLQRHVEPQRGTGARNLQRTFRRGHEEIGVAVGEDIVECQLAAGIHEGLITLGRTGITGPAAADKQPQAQQSAEQNSERTLHVTCPVPGQSSTYSAEGERSVQGWQDDILPSPDDLRAGWCERRAASAQLSRWMAR